MRYQAAIAKSLEITNAAIINSPVRLQLVIRLKTELLSSLFYKTRANTQLVLAVHTGLYRYDE